MSHDLELEISSEHDAYVRHRVAAGGHDSTAEVIRQSAIAVYVRDVYSQEFRDSVQRGLADIEAGRYTEVEDIETYLNERFKAVRERHRANHDLTGQ